MITIQGNILHNVYSALYRDQENIKTGVTTKNVNVVIYVN